MGTHNSPACPTRSLVFQVLLAVGTGRVASYPKNIKELTEMSEMKEMIEKSNTRNLMESENIFKIEEKQKHEMLSKLMCTTANPTNHP